MSSVPPPDHPPPADETLLRRVAAGDADALDRLYARYAGVVFGIARRSLDAGTAEEIVQDAFLALWRNADSYDPTRGPLRPWLLQIVHFRIANELRRAGRRPHAEGNDDHLARLADPDLGPADRMTLETRRAALRSALGALPERERFAIGMAFLDELSHPEVAAALGIPLGTAKSRIRLGMGRLRQSLAAVALLLVFATAAALLVRRARDEKELLARDERALAMVTSSDSERIRLSAVPGLPDATHATWRSRNGSPIAVVTFSSFPHAPAGKVYRLWMARSGHWTPIGTAVPDADGRARLIAENPVLAELPDAIEIRLEGPVPGASPAGSEIVRWRRAE
ncbi:MAG: sigma-70 family RNA polymerase sigma factor [Acidobacteriota bacterium]|nr:sigma-70 family RNA polymerase sigma factor [Acidobacteriota bacterium]